MLVIPAVIALLGSYMVCREEQDDTLKTLRLIPVNKVKLTIVKLMIASIIILLLCGCLSILLLVGLNYKEREKI